MTKAPDSLTADGNLPTKLVRADLYEAQAAKIESLLGDLAKAQDQIKAQAAEIERLRLLVPRPDQTQDELVWRDHMRGVPLAALAKEFGITKERMRYRLKRIAENKLHLTGAHKDGN